jgi:hypothetical protein
MSPVRTFSLMTISRVISLLLFYFIHSAVAKVGFELEFGQFRVKSVAQPAHVIPSKTELYHAPSGLWKLTVDETASSPPQNDLEIVTAPFDYAQPGSEEALRKVMFPFFNLFQLLSHIEF